MAAYQEIDQSTAAKVPSAVTPALLSRDELKPYYGIPAGSINLYMSKYGLPQPVKIGNRTLWRRQDLDLWVEKLPSAQLGTNGVHFEENSNQPQIDQ